MTIELVGLAYDQMRTDAVWSGLTARAAYDLVLEDEFRRKVDFRSMLYHKGQLELLAELEHFLKRGGEKLSLVQLVAARFSAGVEDLPNPSGEFAFDFQLIRYFSSLAMADDFLTAESFLRELLRRVGFLKNGTGWSLLETWDFDGIALALRDVRMQDILEASRAVHVPEESLSFENLVRNYIEFLSYSRNNALTPFFFNSQSDVKRWGNLAERKNRRNELIVDLTLRGDKKTPARKGSSPRPASKPRTRSLEERMKLRRQSDALVWGLKDSDPLIRQKSAESLGRMGESEALPNLIEALSDPEPEVREEIVRAIGAIPGPVAGEALLRALERDESVGVRLAAAYVLRKRKERGAIRILIDGLEKGHPHISAELAYHPMLASDPKGVRRLIALARSGVPEVRREVAFVLGRVPSRVSSGVLEAMAADPDEETRCNALYSLWDLGSKKAGEVARRSSSRDAAIVGHWAQPSTRSR